MFTLSIIQTQHPSYNKVVPVVTVVVVLCLFNFILTSKVIINLINTTILINIT